MYERVVGFLKEVRSELAKVSWPSKDELTGSTGVVVVLSVILAFFIGIIDFVISGALILLRRLSGM